MVTAVAAIAAGPAQARFFGFKCSANQNAQVDPIVSPGVKPSAHLHTFFGARGVTEFSTTASLEGSTTSCFGGFFANGGPHVAMTAAETAANTAGIWIPTMYVNGVARNPAWVTDYWSNTSIRATPVDMAEGQQMIAADAHSTSPPPMAELFWNCGADFTNQWPSSTKPPLCPSNHTLQAHLQFPTCWDGTGTKPTDVINPGAPAFTEAPRFYACPAAFPKTLPHVQLIIHTGLSGTATQQITFSSGPYYTLHGDYWQSWKDQAFLHQAENFLRTGVIP